MQELFRQFRQFWHPLSDIAACGILQSKCQYQLCLMIVLGCTEDVEAPRERSKSALLCVQCDLVYSVHPINSWSSNSHMVLLAELLSYVMLWSWHIALLQIYPKDRVSNGRRNTWEELLGNRVKFHWSRPLLPAFCHCKDMTYVFKTFMLSSKITSRSRPWFLWCL